MKRLKLKKFIIWLVILAACVVAANFLARWWTYRTEAQFDAHLRTARVPELQQILKTRNWDPEVYYWLGARLLDQGRPKDAAWQLVRAAALNPRSASTRALYGLALARSDDPETAERQLRAAIALNPRLEFAYFTLGSLYGRYKRWQQAADVLQTAVNLNPNDREAQYLLALCYGEIYQDDRKMEILEHLVSLEPNNIRYLKSLGYVYLFFGKLTQAEALYRRILTLAPDDTEGHYLLGRALAEEAASPGEFKVAEQELLGAQAKEPDNPSGHLALGILYLRRNEPARAVTELEKAIKLGTTETKAWMYLGQAYQRVGRTADADRMLAVFSRSASTNRAESQLENRLLNTPDDTSEHIHEKADVRMRLIHVYMDDKSYASAINHLSILLKQDPKNAEALKLEKQCEEKLGK